MSNFAVLGLGMMGSAICFDLLVNDPLSRVFGFDIDPAKQKTIVKALSDFKSRFEVHSLNLNVDDNIEDHFLTKTLKELQIDVVFGAIDYKFNFVLSKICIQARCNFVDLGGNPSIVKMQQSLHSKAKIADIVIIPDLGLAPGMVNILSAHWMKQFDSLDTCHIRVGGLPQQPKTILKYQQVFAIRGLTNEYLEDATIIRDKQKLTVPSLTEHEFLTFPEPWGELEAFQTAGGSSSLPDLFEGKINELTYKTIRYPGHYNYFKFLKDFELLSSQTFPKSENLTPREVIEYFLAKNLPKGDPDAVLVKVTITGKVKNVEAKRVYQLIDLMDPETGFSAMARTTSFSTSIIGQMIAKQKINLKGVIAGENAVPPEEFIEELKKRNIIFNLIKSV